MSFCHCGLRPPPAPLLGAHDRDCSGVAVSEKPAAETVSNHTPQNVCC